MFSKDDIRDIVREVLDELGIARNGYLDCSGVRCAEDPDILKVGMILEGTCKCDESKKDYFVVVKGIRKCNLNVLCLTRKDIGWARDNTFQRTEEPRWAITTFETCLSLSKASHGFEEYNYRIIPGLTLDTFREVLKNE